MNYINKTIDYYNENSDEFIKNTYNVDMSKCQSVFLSYLNKNDCILDLGCGSGRDSKIFLNKGYRVTSVDGSFELCKKAEKFIGKEVLNLKFQDIDFENKFHGIWACASLVHINKEDLRDIFNRIILALKENGVLYISFKYGEFEGFRNGRYFIDINEKLLRDITKDFKNLLIDKTWITSDVRKNREEEKWLNAILIKKDV